MSVEFLKPIFDLLQRKMSFVFAVWIATGLTLFLPEGYQSLLGGPLASNYRQAIGLIFLLCSSMIAVKVLSQACRRLQVAGKAVLRFVGILYLERQFRMELPKLSSQERVMLRKLIDPISGLRFRVDPETPEFNSLAARGFIEVEAGQARQAYPSLRYRVNGILAGLLRREPELLD